MRSCASSAQASSPWARCSSVASSARRALCSSQQSSTTQQSVHGCTPSLVLWSSAVAAAPYPFITNTPLPIHAAVHQHLQRGLQGVWGVWRYLLLLLLLLLAGAPFLLLLLLLLLAAVLYCPQQRLASPGLSPILNVGLFRGVQGPLHPAPPHRRISTSQQVTSPSAGRKTCQRRACHPPTNNSLLCRQASI